MRKKKKDHDNHLMLETNVSMIEQSRIGTYRKLIPHTVVEYAPVKKISSKLLYYHYYYYYYYYYFFWGGGGGGGGEGNKEMKGLTH